MSYAEALFLSVLVICITICSLQDDKKDSHDCQAQTTEKR